MQLAGPPPRPRAPGLSARSVRAEAGAGTRNAGRQPEPGAGEAANNSSPPPPPASAALCPPHPHPFLPLRLRPRLAGDPDPPPGCRGAHQHSKAWPSALGRDGGARGATAELRVRPAARPQSPQPTRLQRRAPPAAPTPQTAALPRAAAAGPARPHSRTKRKQRDSSREERTIRVPKRNWKRVRPARRPPTRGIPAAPEPAAQGAGKRARLGPRGAAGPRRVRRGPITRTCRPPARGPGRCGAHPCGASASRTPACPCARRWPRGPTPLPPTLAAHCLLFWC